MKRDLELNYSDYSDEEFDLKGCTYIGEGHNGIVYMLKDGRVIKIFKDIQDGINEYLILKKVDSSRYFPRVYECGENYMIRDYVDGVSLKEYIRKNGTSKKLIDNIIALLEEFKRLNFTKLDIRCKDIFVQDNYKLMVIDPKSTFTKTKRYPHRLMIGMNKVGALEMFIEVLQNEKPRLYKKWILEGRYLEKEDEAFRDIEEL